MDIIYSGHLVMQDVISACQSTLQPAVCFICLPHLCAAGGPPLASQFVFPHQNLGQLAHCSGHVIASLQLATQLPAVLGQWSKGYPVGTNVQGAEKTAVQGVSSCVCVWGGVFSSASLLLNLWACAFGL